MMTWLFIATFFVSSSQACDVVGFLQDAFKVERNPVTYRLDQTQYVVGKSTTLKLADDYSIQLIEARDGTMHAVDSAHPPLTLVEDTKVLARENEQIAPYVKIDKPRVKKLICGEYARWKEDPAFKKIRRSLEEIVSKKKIISGSTKCMRQLGAFAGTFPLWMGFSIARAGWDIHNPVTDHGDNFYMTIPLIGMI